MRCATCTRSTYEAHETHGKHSGDRHELLYTPSTFTMTTGCSKALRWFIVMLVILPLLTSAVIEIHLLDITTNVAFGVYGLWVSLHFFLQLCLATANRHRLDRRAARHGRLTSQSALEADTAARVDIGVQVVGYREDPHIFRQCCQSLKRLMHAQSHLVSSLVCVIDGRDSHDDLQMKDVFVSVFPEAAYVDMDRLPTAEDTLEEYQGHHVTCITQPHDGKRAALWTAFKLNLAKRVDYVLTVDSDTMVDSNAPTALHEAMQSRPNCRAVAGDIRIFNIDTALALLIHLKYWMAFNLERAAQSFMGCVCCVGGPLGLYDTRALKLVLKDWYEQTYCGERCTYGDDRHLTNQMLKHGYSVLYTHRAFCYTDTPTTVGRFARQQKRWNQSGAREFGITMKYLHLHSWYLTFDLVFVTFYSFFIIVVYALILATLSLPIIVALYAVVIVTSGVRALYGCFTTRNPHFLFMVNYGLLYLHVALPAKLWALMSMCDTAWGTSARFRLTNANTDYLPLLLWNSGVAAAVGLSAYRDWDEHGDAQRTAWLLGSLVVVVTLLMSSMTWTCSAAREKRHVQSILAEMLQTDTTTELPLERKEEAKRNREPDSHHPLDRFKEPSASLEPAASGLTRVDVLEDNP